MSHRRQVYMVLKGTTSGSRLSRAEARPPYPSVATTAPRVSRSGVAIWNTGPADVGNDEIMSDDKITKMTPKRKITEHVKEKVKNRKRRKTLKVSVI